MRCRGGLARGGSGVGAPPSHAEKAVGVGGKSGAKWRNQSDQLRIAMSASKSGPQVTHLADNASLLTNAVVMPGWLWCMLSTAQSQLAQKAPQPPQQGTHPLPNSLHKKALTPQHPNSLHNKALTPQQHSHPNSTHTPKALTPR